jgi:uncharacterized protein (DUF2336 family)
MSSLHYYGNILHSYLITPTNSLIALMLGRLRMSVDDATRVYAALFDNVFSKENMKRLKPEAFRALMLEEAFKKVIADQVRKDHGQFEENAETSERMMDPQADSGSCKA